MMVGKRSFTFGMVYFQGRTVKLPGSILPETNSSPLKIGHPKRKFIFRPLMLLSERVSIWINFRCSVVDLGMSYWFKWQVREIKGHYLKWLNLCQLLVEVNNFNIETESILASSSTNMLWQLSNKTNVQTREWNEPWNPDCWKSKDPDFTAVMEIIPILYITSWWFQPIWKILVKMGIFP